jgi:hypothetical protein
MRLARLLIASVALSLSGTAMAGGFVVNLEPGSAGLLRGYAGLHAADARTEGSLVRIVAPGLEIGKRGTIRVLVMNLGEQDFEFGPDNVRLTLPDGTELAKVPLGEFERGYSLITREQERAAAIDRQNRNTLSVLAGQAPAAAGSGGAPTPAPDVNSISRTDETILPGTTMLNAIYEILLPETVAPQTASGGYLVFEMPEQLGEAQRDVPLTIIVRTGEEEHRFAGLLKWRR